MVDINTTLTAPESTQEPLSARLAHRTVKILIPLSAFCAFLFLFLALSKTVLIPHLTKMSLLGLPVPIEQVAPRKQELEAQLAQLQTQRSDRLFGNDALHTFVHSRMNAAQGDMDVLSRVTSLANSQQTPNSVLLQNTQLDRTTQTLVITGDVRNVGPRSMTVLASFVDAVGALDGVSSLQASPFTRDQNSDGSLHSPFTLTLQLHAS